MILYILWLPSSLPLPWMTVVGNLVLTRSTVLDRITTASPDFAIPAEPFPVMVS